MIEYSVAVIETLQQHREYTVAAGTAKEAAKQLRSKTDEAEYAPDQWYWTRQYRKFEVRDPDGNLISVYEEGDLADG